MFNLNNIVFNLNKLIFLVFVARAAKLKCAWFIALAGTSEVHDVWAAVGVMLID